jgi:hypothetical protein
MADDNDTSDWDDETAEEQEADDGAEAAGNGDEG